MGVLKVLTELGWTVVGGGSQQTLTAGDNIIISNNQIAVRTTNTVEAGNTQPVTSDAVYQQIGDIEALLSII